MNEVIEQLQLSALYHASQSTELAEHVFSVASLDDFEPGNQQDVATVIVSLMRRDEVQPAAVAHEVQKIKADLYKWYAISVQDQFYSTPQFCSQKIREHGDARRLRVVLHSAASDIERGLSTDEIVASLQTNLSVTEAHMRSNLDTLNLDDILGLTDDQRPWVMPQMLRTNERLIITGPEGGGKSILVAQICLGASMGVNTLHATYAKHEPMRVLMLDVENDKLQIRDNARKVWPYFKSFSDATPDIEWVDIQHIDLSDPVDEQKVIRLAKERMPHMMYLGSLYRLAPEGDKVDAAFTHVSRTVDRIRAETGASVVLEAHAGHGMANDRNGMRPYGSSMWMRWPEFGMGMNKDRTSGYTRLKAWRGHRSDDRQWPVALRRGEAFPWQAIQADEWEAMGYDE